MSLHREERRRAPVALRKGRALDSLCRHERSFFRAPAISQNRDSFQFVPPILLCIFELFSSLSHEDRDGIQGVLYLLECSSGGPLFGYLVHFNPCK